ncbi:MAG: IclR family transcriptional regulator [Thermomicrobiales bacterium]
MDGKSESIRSLTQSVERALSILTCFSDAQPRLRVADLVDQLGLSQSTVSRLLKTMESLGFVERDPRTGLYQLGLEMVTLAGVALNQVDLRGEAIGELSTVAAELGLAANLSILRHDALFYLGSVEGPMAPKRHTMIGKRGPLHCTGMGKVLLAHLPETEREAILRRIPYPQFTPHTAGSAADLHPMLDGVLRRGYALEREELAFGRACVAAPIRDATGAVIAATSISGPLRGLDLDRREAELAARVVEMADRISQRLGFVGVSVSVLPRTRLQPVGGQ